MAESRDREEKSPIKPVSMGERHSVIHQLIQIKGFVTIDELAHNFQVTPQTIRRDINMLSEKGLIQRYHGGAGITPSTENVAYTTRKVMCLKEKQAIARMLAASIPNHSSLFINIGTTTEEVAKELMGHQGLKIITNNLHVASILGNKDSFEVIVAGGLIRHRDFGIVGPLTIDFLKQFRVDFGIIGISGIDLDGTLLDFDYREVRAARTIIDNSRRVFLAADHTKFGRNAMVRLGSVDELDALFTDTAPPQPFVERLIASDVQLQVVSEAEESEPAD